jgi:hypothetical protein
LGGNLEIFVSILDTLRLDLINIEFALDEVVYLLCSTVEGWQHTTGQTTNSLDVSGNKTVSGFINSRLQITIRTTSPFNHPNSDANFLATVSVDSIEYDIPRLHPSHWFENFFQPIPIALR